MRPITQDDHNEREAGLIEDAGIDALTMTLKSGSKGAERWYRQGLGVAREIERKGNFCVPWSVLGYKGEKTGSYFTGERDDGFMVKLTGADSSWVLSELYRKDIHCSRLDLQVTVRVVGDLTEYAKSIRAQADAYADACSLIGKRRVHVHEGKGEGYTVYVGKRSSAEIGRGYDKEAEGGKDEWAQCFRFEVELKKEQGDRALHRLMASDVTAWAAARDYVGEWWENNGVRVPWTRESTFNYERSPARTKTDVSRVLQWLERDVSPSVRRLLPLVGRATLLAALFGDGTAPLLEGEDTGDDDNG